MRTITLNIIAVVFVLLLQPNCGAVDTSKDFAMTLNGREYNVKMGAALAFISEMDVGFSADYIFYIMFPLKVFNPLKARGFKFAFSPNKTVVGEKIESSAGDEQYYLRMFYYPAVGHKMNQGLMLTYSSGYKQGRVRARFDILEPHIGGRVKGVVFYAALYGYYEDSAGPDIVEPGKENILELYNFTFDTVFSRSMF